MSTVAWLLRRVVINRLAAEWWTVAGAIIAVALSVAATLAVVISAQSALGSFSQSVDILDNQQGSLELRQIDGDFDPKLLANWIPAWGSSYSLWGIKEAVRVLNTGQQVSIIADDRAIADLSTEKADNIASVSPQLLSLLQAGAAFLGIENSALPTLKEDKALQGLTFKGERSHLTLLFSLDPLVTKIFFSPHSDAVAGTAQNGAQWQLPVELQRRGFFLTSRLEERRNLANLLRAFTVNITVMVLMAVLISAIVLFATVRLHAAAYAQDFSTLATLGAQPWMLSILILGESVLVSVGGTLLGLLAGAPLAGVLSKLFLGTASTLYLEGRAIVPANILQHPLFIAVAFGAGILLGILAGVGPAFRAGGVAPGLSLRAALTAPPRFSVPLFLFGIIAAVLSIVSVWLAFQYRFDLLAHVAAFFLVCAVALFALSTLLGAALLARHLFAQIGSASGLFSVSMLSSQFRLMRLPCAVAALSFALLVGLSLMVRSFRDTLAAWSERTVLADLYIRVGDEQGWAGARPLSDALAQQIANIAGISSAINFIRTEQTIEQQRLVLLGSDRALLGSRIPYLYLSDQSCSTAELQDPAQLLLSEAAAYRLKKSRGDSLTIQDRIYKICGVYQDFAAQQGAIQFDFKDLRARYGGLGIFSVNLFLNSDANLEKVKAQARSLVQGVALVIEATELRARILQTFDETFQITKVMKLLVILLTIVAAIASLVQLGIERRAEIALFETLGAATREKLSSVVWGTIVLFLPAALVGIIGGDLLGRLLVFVINPLSFGWTLQWSWLWIDYLAPVGIVTGLIIAVAVLVLPRR